MNESKISFSERCNTFINSKYAFTLLIGIFIIGVINCIVFGTGGSIDTIFGSAEGNLKWLGWVEIVISTAGSILTIFGVILTIRFDKRFIFPLLTGEVLVVLDGILVGYWLTAFSYLIMICFAIHSYMNWVKDEDNTDKMTKGKWTFVSIGFVFYVIFGALIYLFVVKDDLTSFVTWIDILASGVVTFCWYILLNKSKWGFIGFVITDITYIIIYVLPGGTYATAFSYLIYLIIDSTSLISWWKIN